MPGKHSSRPAGLTRLIPTAVRDVVVAVRQHPLRRWYGGVAVLVTVLLLVTSIATVFGRTVGPGYPIIVQPRLPIFPASGLVSTPAGPFGPPSHPVPSSSAAVRVTPTRHPTPSARASTHRTPRARPSTARPSTSRPTTSRPTTAPPRQPLVLTARYIVYTSWREGFVVGIEVTNHSDRSQPWSVKIIHERSDGVRVRQLWNAELEQGGATTNVFTGGDLAPGATLTFGFKATKWVDRPVRPTTCVVRRTPCRIA